MIDWKGIYERRSAAKITAEQARSEYVRLYAERLREASATGPCSTGRS